MADLPISKELAERIRKAAEEVQLDVEAYLDSIVPSSQPGETATPNDDEPIPGTFGELAALARRANIQSGYTDTVERSREILNEDFPEYLSRYQRDYQDDDE